MKLPTDEHLKENPFTAPEGYFDQLEQTIKNRVTGSAPALPWYRPALRLASMAAGIALIVWFLMPSAEPRAPEEILAQISEEDIALYLEVQDALAAEDVLLPAEEETLLTDLFAPDSLL